MESSDKADPPSHKLGAIVVALLLAVGLGWGVWCLIDARISAEQVSPQAWADGTAGGALNKAMHMPRQAELDTWNAALRYRTLGDLGDQVALGCPQWLFYRDGLRPQPGVHVFNERLRLMRYWVDELRKKQVQVLVVAVPDKSRIESDHLCGLPVSIPMRQTLDAWQAALQAEGVPFVDVRDALLAAPAPRFFRTDVHMNAQGAQAAAQRVADAALPLLQGRGQQAFKTEEPGPAQPRMGDLIVLSGLEHARPGWRPELDSVRPQNIEPIRSGGLLDEAPPVEVLLAGTSNGRRSNFGERLGIGLGREVWNMSLDGGQFSGALLVALNQREQWPKSLKLLIWEFSENALSLPLTQDEKSVLARLP
ncbi:cell division protein FtsQ [Achromobacter seleniivolatilans]|uniref:Cell division protein FtsQ n=1 Tax=Achromobacter seleniivolatilans TaxID=3047478 RepID=A0ABY9MAC0_9BURK|nr:cell division protein FtsQ [Achromobacter sp. R39]WMD23553.1 cell division protein FtsQ [Achromobacter sp. R39]